MSRTHRPGVKSHGGRKEANNNYSTVRELAYRSIKSSRMRNVFVVLTIILSVSLLMVMALFYAGVNTAFKRQVAGMQHAVYYGITEEQLNDMAQDSESTYVLGMKQGQSVEIDGRMVSPTAYASAPLKSLGDEPETISPVKGKEPEQKNEVMLSDAYCKEAGISPEPGAKVSFTWLDGTTEEYVISGIFHTEEHQPVYAVVFSERYASEGSQLKNADWQGIVRLKNAEKMSQKAFEEAVYSFGEVHDVIRKNMNINNYFLRSLPGGDEAMQEMMVVTGVGIGILFVSVLVIYSVFYLSVVGRIRQFGQLRTIGMTTKQIRRMVRIEGLVLSAVGIPAGLVIGGVISYALQPAGWSWGNTAAVSAAVIVADIITVLISIRKPAKVAASVSPLEAMRYSGYDLEETPGQKNTKRKRSKECKDKKQPHTHRLSRKITPVNLAVMSVSRNKKKTALTVLSLGIGGVMYMLAAVYASSVDLESYARGGDLRYGEFVIGYSYNVTETAEHGEAGMQLEHPMGDEIISRIEEIDGVEKVMPAERVEVRWNMRGDSDTGRVKVLKRERTDSLRKKAVQGEFTYDELVQKDGILFARGGAWNDAYGWEPEIGDEVTLNWYDGKDEKERNFTIMGIIRPADLKDEPGDSFSTFLLPEETLDEMLPGVNRTDTLVVKSDTEKQVKIESELNNIISDYPWLEMDTLREKMLMTEVQFNLLFSIIIGLSIFIIGFAMLNLLNTIITNILTRDHEFAMLQSVGMTGKQLSRMLRAEGMVLAVWNLVITFIVGTAAGYAMVEIMRHLEADYMNFNFPLPFFLGYAAFIIIVPVLVTEYMVRRFQKKTLVERLRD